MPIPKKHEELVFAVFMAFTMSMLMSAMVTLLNLGLAGFPWRWLRAWSIAFTVALPLILVLAPLGRRFAAAVTEKNE